MSDSLSAALATLRSRYGPQALRRGEMPEQAGTWATAVPVLDGVLTPGGLPHGRVTLLAAAGRGPSGRLTLLQSLVALASRSHDIGYVDLAGTLDPGFLADLGADLDACLVISPGPERWERGLVMARALVTAGMPWVGVGLGGEQPRASLWEHALAALAEAVAKRGAICVVSAPAPVAAPLCHTSSLTLTCTAAGWQRANGDVAGLRVRLTTAKSKLGAPGAEATVLLRYPRPYATAEVVGLPSVVVPRLQPVALPIPAVAGVAARG
jgi:recA bacterial DNA recombination protein